MNFIPFLEEYIKNAKLNISVETSYGQMKKFGFHRE